MLEQAKEIINYHKSERCFKCDNLVEKGENGIFKCSNCGFEWANLFIKRIPSNTFLAFKEYADKEFCSDYGMALKSMIDMSGMLNVLSVLEERIIALENKKPEEVKEITLLSGKKLRKGGRENGRN